jgi:hypothetical protein
MLKLNRPRHKSIRLFIIFALVIVTSLATIRPFEVATAQSPDQTQYFNRGFGWNYGGNYWTWNISIPNALYDAYQAVPDSQRIHVSISNFGFFTTTQDIYIQSLVSKLNETAAQQGYSAYDAENFVLAFVQSIPYETDYNSTGFQVYPRFPIETLVDNVGDCKSHSILFATLTLAMGYGAVYINPPDHLAVGVLGNNLQGTYWEYNNQTYYYCETTGSGFKIGDLPDQIKGQTAYVYPIDDSLQYVPKLQQAPTVAPDPTIAPYGTTPVPTLGPNAITTPNVNQPTIEPASPLSNIVSSSPLFFIIIVIAIGASIAATVKTARRTRQTQPVEAVVSPESSSPKTSEDTEECNKYCIYCGQINKSCAVFCEKCGKKIG